MPSLYDYTKFEAIKSCLILIVDDIEFNRNVLRRVFEKSGFHNIEEATNGEEALRKVVDLTPDLILLDIVMPKMDGYGFCQAIREMDKFKQTPILVQTVVNDSKQLVKIFNCGATDYVKKNIDPNEIIARSVVHLERYLLMREFFIYKKRTEKELSAAGRYVNGVIIPRKQDIEAIEKKYNITIESHFEPSFDIGGDFWGLMEVSEHEFAFYLVDVSGHGLIAALNAFSINTVMKSHVAYAKNPGEYVSKVNTAVTPLLDTQQFCTLFFCVIDVQKNTMKYTTGGCPDPMVFSQKNNTHSFIDSKGMPIGMKALKNYKTKEIEFCPGDVFLGYSDAIIETEGKDGEFMPTEKLADYIDTDISSNYAFGTLLEDFDNEYRDNLTDDLTVVSLSRK